MVRISSDIIPTSPGPFILRQTFAVCGLTPEQSNAVPFPEPLHTVPFRVFMNSVGWDGGTYGLLSLDTTQGAPDPTGVFDGGKLGFDQNNIYVIIGNTSMFLLTVESGL
jgi:hypothetical protein